MEQCIKTDEEFACVFFVEHHNHIWYIRLLWFIKYDVLRVWLILKEEKTQFYSEAQTG